MISWLTGNWVNILLILAVVAVVTLILRSQARDRRAGKSPCGGNCATCGGCPHK